MYEEVKHPTTSEIIGIRRLDDGAFIMMNDDNLEYQKYLTWKAEGNTPESAEIISNYRSQRAAEYPSIGDQLDALFHAGMLPQDLTIQIQAIKAKYPKV